MLARNEIIFKWALYALAALVCLFVQGVVLQRVTIWGVIPFVFPLVAVIPDTFEKPTSATIFSLCVGVVCDLVLPGTIPCFYTLVFPVVGLWASLLSQSILPAGFLCSLVGTALAFFATGLFHCLLLWAGGKAAWGAAAFVALREFCVTVPLIVPVTLLFRAVFRKTHLDD